MKLNEAIQIADKLRDNAIDEAQKLIWINELETKIQSLILHTAPDDMIVYEQVDDTEMLVPRPFDKVYYLHLAAMIDYGNAEYDKYQNDKAMADAAYSDYAKWFMRHFHVDGNVLYIGGTTKYGLSAYQIAVNHGFEGSEEEWIESLNGKDAYEVAVGNGYQGSEDEFYAQLGVLSGLEERVSEDAAVAEAAAERTEAAADRAESASVNTPKIVGGTWWVFDAAKNAYVDTGVQAKGEKGDKGNGVKNIAWVDSNVLYDENRVKARSDTYCITLDDGSTFNFTVNGGADGTPGAAGAGIRDIYFSGETEEGRLYYAMVGMKAYPILVPKGDAGRDAALFVQDNEPAEAKVGDLWFDTDEEVETPSGGASSWNDLTDKPFSEVYGDTLTWDGNIDGLVSVDGAAYKISDATPSVDEVMSGSLTATVDGETGTIPLADYPPEEMGSGVALYFYAFLVVPESAVGVDIQGLVFPEAGLYVVPAMVGAVLRSLTIPGYTGFKTETINASCIPSTIQRTITGTPGDFVVIGEDGKVTTGEPPAGGGEARFPKFELLHSHVVSEEESTSAIGWGFGKNEIPNLNDYNVFVVTLRSPDGSNFKITAWLKLRINGVNFGEISGMGQDLKSYAVVAHRLFGVWVSNAIYNPKSDLADLLPVIHRHNVFTSTVDASTEVTNIGLYSYTTNFGVIAGAIIDIYGAK